MEITVVQVSAYVIIGCLLFFAAGYDIAKHEVPDIISVLILIAGIPVIQIVPAMLGLFLVPLPLLAAALLKEGSIGGGDIKLMGTCGFVLGVSGGYFALVAGLLLAVLVQPVFASDRSEGFALVPYLAAGWMIAMFVGI